MNLNCTRDRIEKVCMYIIVPPLRSHYCEVPSTTYLSSCLPAYGTYFLASSGRNKRKGPSARMVDSEIHAPRVQSPDEKKLLFELRVTLESTPYHVETLRWATGPQDHWASCRPVRFSSLPIPRPRAARVFVCLFTLWFLVLGTWFHQVF